jgi:hypothetical protein
MPKERVNNVWWIMLVLSCLFLAFTVFAITSGEKVLENGLKQFAGSSFDLANLDEAAHGFLTMSMIKPLWEELWIGILGIFFALGLKQKMKYAFRLSIVWSIMMLANGIVQGGYEMFILGWSAPCAQTYIFLFLGIIALVSLLVARKGFSLSTT